MCVHVFVLVYVCVGVHTIEFKRMFSREREKGIPDIYIYVCIYVRDLFALCYQLTSFELHLWKGDLFFPLI